MPLAFRVWSNPNHTCTKIQVFLSCLSVGASNHHEVYGLIELMQKLQTHLVYCKSVTDTLAHCSSDS